MVFPHASLLQHQLFSNKTDEPMKLLVKNMVCDRCIKVLKDELFKANISLLDIELGRLRLDIDEKELSKKALIRISAILGGLIAGMPLEEVISSFNSGLGGGASIALNYAMLGAFAVAISKSGLTRILASKLLKQVNENSHKGETTLSYLILSIILLCAISSQNLIPVHIAFIPILIPPLLVVFNKLRLDRRAIACILTFGLATSYMVLPYGFGGIYLYSILHKNLTENGLEIVNTQVPMAMIIPAIGMSFGLLVAVFISYRKRRSYESHSLTEQQQEVVIEQPKKVLAVGITAVLCSLVAQNISGSMILGGLVGVAIFTLFGVVK